MMFTICCHVTNVNFNWRMSTWSANRKPAYLLYVYTCTLEPELPASIIITWCAIIESVLLLSNPEISKAESPTDSPEITERVEYQRVARPDASIKRSSGAQYPFRIVPVIWARAEAGLESLSRRVLANNSVRGRSGCVTPSDIRHRAAHVGGITKTVVMVFNNMINAESALKYHRDNFY